MAGMMMPAEPGGDSGHDRKGRQISVMFPIQSKAVCEQGGGGQR